MTTKAAWTIGVVGLAACIGHMGTSDDPIGRSRHRAHVRPGITVLLEDSLALVRGKRLALITNQTGVNEHGVSDIDLLAHADVHLVRLFSPEHGMRGREDRMFVSNDVDSSTGLPVYSLYGKTVLAPPDSLLGDIDFLVFDLQDVGTRTWTYVGTLIQAMHAAARMHVAVIVLDRPNPLSGLHVQGAMLDSTLADTAIPYALYPMPLRHGLTMGELARFYNDTLGLRATLHVMPARGWRRELWWDETHLPWVGPSPNLPSFESELTYPALVPFESTNLSVGRGTPKAFQQLGAPWLDAARVVDALSGLALAGVRFRATEFTPDHPTDGKYGGRRVSAIYIEVTDRDRVDVGRLGGALLWAVARVNRDSLRVDTAGFDRRFGVPAYRASLLSGTDPDAVLDQAIPAAIAFERRSRRFWLYH
jgi:uncharacterized protein YbbC (DUF1343 family)